MTNIRKKSNKKISKILPKIKSEFSDMITTEDEEPSTDILGEDLVSGSSATPEEGGSRVKMEVIEWEGVKREMPVITSINTCSETIPSTDTSEIVPSIDTSEVLPSTGNSERVPSTNSPEEVPSSPDDLNGSNKNSDTINKVGTTY